MADYMVSPRGEYYDVGESHPEWAHENYLKFGIQFDPMPDSFYDAHGHHALAAFLQDGWIRVKGHSGVELMELDQGNAELVKSILRKMSKDVAGLHLYVETWPEGFRVPVSWTGRPDFSDLDARVGNAVTAWLRSNLRLAQEETTECPDFGSMLTKGTKGMLLNDGSWFTWPVDQTGNPHHDDVIENCFKYQNYMATAVHWFDGILYINSDDKFSDQTQTIMGSYYGNRGTGSHIIIEANGETWEGDFRKYQKELGDHEAVMVEEDEGVLASWVTRNCAFAA